MTWIERLLIAQEAGGFSGFCRSGTTDRQSDKRQAGNFLTCAVAERAISLCDEDDCSDKVLSKLGFQFYHAVMDDKVSEAFRIYNEIQQRANDLSL